eukprot:sb/3478151/
MVQEPIDTSKQPNRTHYLGHVTGYQPIRNQYFLISLDQLTQIMDNGEQGNRLIQQTENTGCELCDIFNFISICGVFLPRTDRHNFSARDGLGLSVRVRFGVIG